MPKSQYVTENLVLRIFEQMIKSAAEDSDDIVSSYEELKELFKKAYRNSFPDWEWKVDMRFKLMDDMLRMDTPVCEGLPLAPTYMYLKEIFKDSEYMGIYTGREYNDYLKHYAGMDGGVDKEWEHKCIVACGKFGEGSVEGSIYIEGEYSITYNEEGKLYMIWDSYPSPPIIGITKIIEELKKFQIPDTPEQG